MKLFLIIASILIVAGCTADQAANLDRAGDTVIRTSAAATQPVNLVLPGVEGQPPATISVGTGVFGTAAAAIGMAFGLLLKQLAASLPRKEEKK